ncbi:methyltransferase domain-containing protein [Agrobacterium radiobacter]|uniref:class I SAM-dependent methyltransferase n=1 Tax=Agrobacterium TaxID=357 RepID=UPI000D1FA179|nr:methyltransferase domain-containing protein [Agrobacterium sp. LAD9]
MNNESCPCCGLLGTTYLFQRRLDVSGDSVEMCICSNCTSITNRTNLIKERGDSGEALKVQIDSADGFYSQKIDDLRLQHNRDNISFLNYLVGHIIGGKNVVDLGAGEGYLAAAACSFYETAWAVDINVGLLTTTVPQFGLGDKLKVAGSLDDVPDTVDAVFMWHTLEHIPNAHDLGKAVAAKLNEGGLFIWQVPAYRDNYVVFSHYTFFNDHSARVFTESIGLEIVDVFHDEALQFLTVVSKKPETLIIETTTIAVERKPSIWQRLGIRA